LEATRGPRYSGRMRFTTFLRVVVFVAVFGWAGYTAAMIAYDYFNTSGLVGQLVVDAVNKRKAGVAAGGSPAAMQEIANDVRGMIVRESRRLQLPVEEETVKVTPASYAIQVAMQWKHPVVLYGDARLFDVTLWMDRSFDTNF
jgi:hypothetical protein